MGRLTSSGRRWYYRRKYERVARRETAEQKQERVDLIRRAVAGMAAQIQHEENERQNETDSTICRT